MSVKNAYRQGYSNSEIGCDDDNPYKRMNKTRDAYAYERGFNDFKNGMIYQPPHLHDDFISGRIVSSDQISRDLKPFYWKHKTKPHSGAF